MGNTIPHGDRLHECSTTCPEAKPVGPAVDGLLRHFGVEGDFVMLEHGEGLRKREGDQELPVPNDEVSCQQRFMDRVNHMAPARMELGRKRYGTLLQPFNGRDFVQDVFEEMFDAWAYLEGVAAEREAMMDLLYDVAYEEPNESLQRRARALLLSMGQALDLRDAEGEQ